MSLWNSGRALFALVAAFSLGVAAFAADDKAKKDEAADAKQAAAKSPSPEEAAKQMEAYMALAKPGEPHQRLQRLVGEYDVESEMVMQPGAPPQKSKGKQKYAAIMGGRYIHGDFTGEMMGMTFHGASLMGYDNFKKKYFSAWIDDMGTGIMLAEGTASKDGKVITLTGEYEDPMDKKTHKYRWVTTVLSDDKHTFDWFDSDKEGKNEYRMLHITYTRAK